MKRILHLLISGILIWSCAVEPSPEQFPKPDFEQVSIDDGVKGEVTFTCRMSSMSQLTAYGIYYAEADEADAGNYIKVPGVKSGEDTFIVTLRNLVPGTTYTYSLYISNGRKEEKSSQNHFTVPE